MFRIPLILLFAFFQSLLLTAQEDTLKQDTRLFAGVGNYEYVHVGINIPVKKKCYFEVGIGIKPFGFNNYNYQMAYVCFGRKLLREKSRKINPCLHLKALCWHFNNQYNEFVVLGVNPELQLTYSITKKIAVFLNGGLIYNAPLYYERKTYMEVGWPHEWQPSCSVQLLYRLK